MLVSETSAAPVREGLNKYGIFIVEGFGKCHFPFGGSRFILIQVSSIRQVTLDFFFDHVDNVQGHLLLNHVALGVYFFVERFHKLLLFSLGLTISHLFLYTLINKVDHLFELDKEVEPDLLLHLAGHIEPYF